MNDDQLRWVTAYHEAGHAVMRWLRGLPATDVHVNEGYGLCEGMGEQIRGEDALLVMLAGPVVEADYNPKAIVLEDFSFEDLTIARDILDKWEYLRLRIPEVIRPGASVELYSVEESLSVWFNRACTELRPHFLLVEEVAHAAIDGYLSAADLQAILAQYEQELENNG